jgi:hypothetical protein
VSGHRRTLARRADARQHALAGEQHLRHLAERQAEDGSGRAEHRGAGERPAELAREGGVRDRLGRRRVHGAAPALVLERRDDEARHVVAMDPRHPLLAAADGTTDEGAERRQHARERAADGGEHDAEAEADHAHAGALRRERLVLPRGADPGEEVAAGSRRLVERLVPVRAVVPDGGRAQQDAGPRLRRRDRGDEPPRRLDAAVADASLLLLRPTARGDRLAGQVHDGFGLAHRLADVVPSDAAPVREFRVARDDADRMTRAAERMAERRPDEAGAAGDEDAHARHSVWVE